MLRYYTDRESDMSLLKEVVEIIRKGESAYAVPGVNAPEIIYDERNRLYALDGEKGDWVIKSFRVPIAIQRIIYTFFRPSKAARSYRNAICLERCNLGTPTPLGYAIESRHGLLYKSYYVCGRLDEARDIRLVMQGLEGNDDLLRAFAQLIARLHDEGVLHIDLSPGNVLYRADGKGGYLFYLVDLNRMKFFDQPISGRLAYENFARLSFHPEISERLAEYYAAEKGLEPSAVVRGVQTLSDRFFGSKVRKYARKALVKEQKQMSKSDFRHAYFRYRLVRRMRKLSGSASLFRRESELYDTYLRVGDLRGVLRRREGYKTIGS